MRVGGLANRQSISAPFSYSYIITTAAVAVADCTVFVLHRKSVCLLLGQSSRIEQRIQQKTR